MKKTQKRHRIIASFFLLIFFPTIVPTSLYASNNGPKSPEAASFEPVDATDMVNLITGQYSYVLPLLNVPSPEGGYPIALGYHAGIALDQEASWTGLGWNVNPGAIDRGVNGYPDDYNASKLSEYFWDRTHTESFYSASISYSPDGINSVGVGFNWGSNQALSGSVSLSSAGLGSVRFSERDGVSYNINVLSVSYQGLSVGVGYSSESGWNANAGYADTNGAGFSVSTSGGGELSLNASKSTGISFSSNGSHSVSLGGVEMSTSFNNSVQSGDYNTSSNSSNYFLPIPIPGVGIFSLSFGKQEFKYWLGKNVDNFVTGPIYYKNGVSEVLIYYSVWIPLNGHETQDGHWEIRSRLVGKAFMDINEVPIINNDIGQSVDMSINNMTFPSYDSYNIQAQGLSGSMSSPLFENGALFGLSDRENNQGYALKYDINGASSTTPINTKFDSKPFFYLENEISTYLNMADVPSAIFNTTNTNTLSLNHYSSGVDLSAKPRRKTSTFVEYYTNDEIRTNYTNLKQNGYLQDNASGFSRTGMPKDGIGAFKITAVDGKTYHYSLPVYNHEIITRTFGSIPDSRNEWESYFEKRQLEPFATHWLLTAVTGPDFVDNGDGIAGVGDLGYWTSFDYGKWTDAFIWKAPFKKDYIIDDKDPNIKTWIRGRKQLYYLDKVKTRTHTALFIKSHRDDSPSENWSYNSARHINNLQDNSVEYQFNVPSQPQLKLDKIILVKNQDDNTDKTYGLDNNSITTIAYNQSDKPSEVAKFNITDNILDTGDNWQSCVAKAVKVIDFNYDYSLVPGDNRLTLKSVNFKGKTGNTVIPPYKFEYFNNSSFNIDNKDGWGYVLNNPETFSLNKITTPQGGTINIAYETNKALSVTKHQIEFNKTDINYLLDNIAIEDLTKLACDIKSTNNLGLRVGDQLKIEAIRKYKRCDRQTGNGDRCNWVDEIETLYNGNAIVTQVYGINNKLRIKTINNINSTSNHISVFNISAKHELGNNPIEGGGIRVASISFSDGNNSFYTDYKYGQNENGIGYVSYVPFSQNVAKELPYSSELPAPRVMYEYVSVSSRGQATPPNGKLQYKFNVIKQKTPNAVEFGDFYKINKVETPTFTNTSNKSVNISAFTVHDNLASVGQLLEMTTFNSQGQQLSKISNDHYKTTDVIPNNMGKTQESYQSYKTVDYTNPATQDKWLINSSTRIKYPNLIKSSTEQKSGYTYTTNFNDYDLISGVSKEQVSFSSDGKSLKTTTVPAYLKYPEMGSKVTNINNKNMLSQTAASYSYILDASNNWKETGVGITTWFNNWTYRDIQGNTATPTVANQKIWRKHKTYIWNGQKDTDGIFSGYASATDDGFVWGVGLPQTNAKWKQASEITLYDNYSAPLEMKDVNGNLASTKMGDNDSKIMTTGNAGYSELFYAGAENLKNITGTDWLEPEVKMVNATREPAYFHTGKYSVATTSSSQFGVNMKANEHRAGKYKLNVWVHKTNVNKAQISINGSTSAFNGETVTAGDWVLKTHYFPATTAAINVSVNSSDGTTVYYDDLMIRPIVSSISGYVYNEYDELTYIIGNNGLASKFDYDNAGRLIRTSVEIVDDLPNGLTGGFKKVSENIIKYKNL